MTLPFNNNDNKKSYCCFVCGVIFNDFNEFKEHIIKEHEEGREYIKCPLERCGAPVRDMRSHFRIYHPTESLNKTIQLRAMVWKDFGTKKKRKVVFKEGNLVSIKNHGTVMHYRSSYEKQVYECLEKWNKVVSYQVEPFKIPYHLDGKSKTYWPDLKINFIDDSVEIWEVKPGSQTNIKQNQAKWAACQEVCESRGWKFVVKTEKGINKLLIEVADQR